MPSLKYHLHYTVKHCLLTCLLSTVSTHRSWPLPAVAVKCLCYLFCDIKCSARTPGQDDGAAYGWLWFWCLASPRHRRAAALPANCLHGGSPNSCRISQSYHHDKRPILSGAVPENIYLDDEEFRVWQWRVTCHAACCHQLAGNKWVALDQGRGISTFQSQWCCWWWLVTVRGTKKIFIFEV